MNDQKILQVALRISHVYWSVCVCLGLSFFGFFPLIVSAGSPQAVHLDHARQAITPERFHQVIVDYLRHQVSSPQTHVNARLLSPIKPVMAPRGKLSLKVVPSPLHSRTGRRVFRVGLHVDSHLFKTINVIEAIHAESVVVLPVRWIKVNEILELKDVVTRMHELTSLQQDVVFDVHDVVGKKAQRPLSPQQPIRRSFLTVPPMIHKGDRVILEVRQGGLLVQTVGIARASGHKGSTIPIHNQQSGREVLGRILSSRVVEVQF